MPDELRECPFCGGEARAFQFGHENAYVICQRCQGKQSVLFPEIKGAILAWNTRDTESTLRAALNEACETLEFYAKSTQDQWPDFHEMLADINDDGTHKRATETLARLAPLRGKGGE